MHVVLDARKYFDFGIGTYIRNLVLQIAASEKLTLLVAPGDADRIDRIPGVTTKINTSGKYSLRELFSIAEDANTSQADIFHSPHYTVPFGLRMPCVTTIHDILHIRGREYFSLAQQAYARMMVAHACRASDAVLVDSEFTKRELLTVFRMAERRIHVIHLGVAPLYSIHPPKEELEAFRAKYRFPAETILYTGSLKPHKNIPTLISAFVRLKHRDGCRLVFSGEPVLENREVRSLIEANSLSGSVIDLGQLSRRELSLAYHAATVVVLPSLYEGFGFSVLEAMAAGTMAIGARAASIPEIMGDAGCLFDPHSPDDLATAITKSLDDAPFRTAAIEKGFANVQRFSWTKCADETMHVYRNLL